MTAARLGVAATVALGLAQCAEISLPKAAAAPGASLVLPVSFASKSGFITGLQFDLKYDSPAVSLSATVGEAARNSGKTLYLLDLAPGHRRFLLVGFNRNPILDGAIVNLFASVPAGAAGGAHPLQLLNVTGSGQDAGPVPVAGVDGAITVEGAPGSGSRLRPEGVLNGASLLPGPVAPGEIVTLIGAGIGPASPQPAEGPGPSVLFDGAPAPLLYAASNQINAIAPYGIGRGTSTLLQITQQGGQAIAEVRLPVAAAAPAIFTLDASGAGAGAILNQDLTVNSPSDPAEKGSTIILFAGGAGETDPAGADGLIAGAILPRPVLPVAVQIGRLNARVLYAGAAPGMIAGVLQVNCTVPAEAPSGHAVPITLSVGNFNSQAGVTVAVR